MDGHASAAAPEFGAAPELPRAFVADLEFIGELMTRLAQPYEHSWK